MEVAIVLASVLKIYAAIGLVFGVLFVRFGVTKVDAATRGTGLGFRLIILPATVAFWPLLLARWVRS